MMKIIAIDIDDTLLTSQQQLNSTMVEAIHQSLQMPVNQYLRQVRLINARRMLLQSDATIDYIATQTGFGSVKSLMRNFKAWKQVTPTAYRQAAAINLILTPLAFKIDRYESIILL